MGSLVVGAAADREAHVIGVDPSSVMLDACRRRCAEHTHQADESVDVVISVNNVQSLARSARGLREQHRILRPGGRMLVSAHENCLPGGVAALTEAVTDVGFTGTATWTWEPPGTGAVTAVQLPTRRPSGYL